MPVVTLIWVGENMGKQKLIVIIIVLFVMVSGIFYSVSYEKTEEAVFVAEEAVYDEEEIVQGEEKTVTDIEEAEKSEERILFVHICGQVELPGVYCLEEESRITDLIELAGGFTADAARDYINLAQKLSDGQKIYIPSLDEVTENDLLSENGSAEQLNGALQKININSANKDTLMTLTGIGEAKAEAIIQYREKNGGFESIEELKQIEGIKDGVFNKIKDEIEI